MIYSSLIAHIQDTLESVSAIKAVYPYPVTNIAKYPAAIFFPDSIENSFESTRDNKKSYRFKLYIVVGTTQKDKFDIFNTILPKAVDAVIAAFDAAWDGGTIDGHRVWAVVNSGAWTMGVTQNGLEATAELNVTFQLLTAV